MRREDMQRGLFPDRIVSTLSSDRRFRIALTLLDAEIAKSELLRSVTPIRLASIGGSLAVCLLRNRESTYDIDCILDPNLASAAEYADEFKQAVASVARNGRFAHNWLNRQLEMFVMRNRRGSLFMESVEQNIELYKGPNLTIFAARLDWALERKMRRVAHAKDRRLDKNVDVSDAAALVSYMAGRSGHPLTFDYVKGLNYNGFDLPPTHEALQEVANFHIEKYGAVGLVDAVWDPEDKEE